MLVVGRTELSQQSGSMGVFLSVFEVRTPESRAVGYDEPPFLIRE